MLSLSLWQLKKEKSEVTRFAEGEALEKREELLYMCYLSQQGDSRVRQELLFTSVLIPDPHYDQCMAKRSKVF